MLTTNSINNSNEISGSELKGRAAFSDNLLRKLEVVPTKLLDMPDTPFKAINIISKDLDKNLKKFFKKF